MDKLFLCNELHTKIFVCGNLDFNARKSICVLWNAYKLFCVKFVVSKNLEVF